MECVVCSDVFKTPKSLPCGHSFCLNCIDGWAATSGKTQENGDILTGCPECRSDFTLPKGTASNLPTNIGLARAAEKITEYKAADDHQGPVCDKHPRCFIDYFCRDCDIPVCVKDHKTDHFGHTWITMEKKGEEIHKKLKMDLRKLDELRCFVKTRKDQWDSAISSIKNNRRELIQSLKEKEEEMISIIKKSIAKIKSDVAKEDEEFWEQCESANTCAVKVLDDLNKTQYDVCAFLQKSSACQKYTEQQKYQTRMKVVPDMSSLREPIWNTYSWSVQGDPENIITEMCGTYQEEMYRPHEFSIILKEFNVKTADDQRNCGIRDVTVMVNGSIAVVDQQNKNIKVLSPIGEVIQVSKPGMFSKPSHVCCVPGDPNSLVVLDNRTVIRWHMQNDELSPFLEKTDYAMKPRAISTGCYETTPVIFIITGGWLVHAILYILNSAGSEIAKVKIYDGYPNLYLPDYISGHQSLPLFAATESTGNKFVYGLDNTKKWGSFTTGCKGVALLGNGCTVFADIKNEQITFVSPDGSKSWNLMTSLKKPRAVAVDERRRLLVIAEDDSGRILLYQY